MNERVITMQAVVEVPAFADQPPWPVAAIERSSWLALNAGCTDDQVGVFVAAVVDRIDVAPPGGRDEVVDALLAEQSLIVAGGLRIEDTSTGMLVVPGCCVGLEDWRNWAELLTDGVPWLGHDPAPAVEVVGDDLRVWQDGGLNRHRGHGAGCHVDLPRRALPQLLRNVQRDLTGLLDALTGWAARAGLGQRGVALVEAVDRDFMITAPWNPPVD